MNCIEFLHPTCASSPCHVTPGIKCHFYWSHCLPSSPGHPGRLLRLIGALQQLLDQRLLKMAPEKRGKSMKIQSPSRNPRSKNGPLHHDPRPAHGQVGHGAWKWISKLDPHPFSNWFPSWKYGKHNWDLNFHRSREKIYENSDYINPALKKCRLLSVQLAVLLWLAYKSKMPQRCQTSQGGFIHRPPIDNYINYKIAPICQP